MTADDDRIAELEAEIAALKRGQAGPVDYRDEAAALDERIAAAEAAGDIAWSVPLKLRRARDAETAGPVDFVRDGDALSLREQADAALDAGDPRGAIALRVEHGRQLREHGQSEAVERTFEQKAGVQAAIEQRQQLAAAGQAGTKFGRQEPGVPKTTRAR